MTTLAKQVLKVLNDNYLYLNSDLITLEDVADYIDMMNEAVKRNQGYIVHRQELDNRPEFKGFLGPMWNGVDEEGSPIFRYETQEMYDLFSE